MAVCFTVSVLPLSIVRRAGALPTLPANPPGSGLALVTALGNCRCRFGRVGTLVATGRHHASSRTTLIPSFSSKSSDSSGFTENYQITATRQKEHTSAVAGGQGLFKSQLLPYDGHLGPPPHLDSELEGGFGFQPTVAHPLDRNWHRKSEPRKDRCHLLAMGAFRGSAENWI